MQLSRKRVLLLGEAAYLCKHGVKSHAVVFSALCYDFFYPQNFWRIRLRIFVSGLVCVLLAGVATGQSNTQPVVKPRVSTPVQELPGPAADTKVAPEAPVITIQGFCDKSKAAADCKTVITRAEFEKIVNALQPNMPKQQQKALAT